MKFLNFFGASAAFILATSAIGATQVQTAGTQEQPATAQAAPDATPTEAPAQEIAAGDAVKGKETFGGRCTSCHTDEGFLAPTPATLGTFPPERIREALKTGIMVENATGLTDSDISDIIAYLTTQPESAS